MLRAITLCTLVALGAGAFAPVAAQDPDTDQQIKALRQELRTLQAQEKELRERLDAMTEKHDTPPAGTRRGRVLRRYATPDFEGRFEDLGELSERLEERFRDLELDFGGRFPRLEGIPGLRERLGDLTRNGLVLGDLPKGATNRSVRIEQTENGVKVEIRSRDGDGEEKAEHFEAASMDELLRDHPELSKTYGLLGLGKRRFEFRFGPDDARPEGLPNQPRARPSPPRAPKTLGVWVEIREEGGLQVNRIADDSLAERLDLRPGDVIRSINGTPVEDVDDVRSALEDAGDKISVTIDRHGKSLTLDARVGRRPI